MRPLSRLVLGAEFFSHEVGVINCRSLLALASSGRYTTAMRRASRRWWLWSAVAVLPTAFCSISFCLPPRDRVTMGHLGKLKLGMEESQVRRILGQEPTPIPCADTPPWKQVDPSWSAQEWTGKYMRIRILFD